MKRVAVVMPPLLPMPPVCGGAVETLTDQLLRAGEAREDFSFEVFSRQDDAAEAAATSYRRSRFHFIPVNDTALRLRSLWTRGIHKLTGRSLLPEQDYLDAVCARLSGQHWDAVLIENVVPFTLPLLAVSSAPLYLHIHNRYLRPGLEWSQPILESRAQVIAISRFLAEEALSVPGARRSRVHLLPNSIDTTAFDAARYPRERLNWRCSLGVPATAPLLLFAGRLLPEKGAREALEAFLGLRDSHPEAHLMIVGERWFAGARQRDRYRQALAERADDWPGHVHFTGLIPYDRMPAAYAAADIAVLPSLWEEPSGLTVLEALSSGLPLITTGAGGIAELINEDCALVTPRGPELTRTIRAGMAALIDDAPRRARMSRFARKAAAPYDKASYYERFLSILNQGGEGR